MKLLKLLPILLFVFGIAFLVSFTATKVSAKYNTASATAKDPLPMLNSATIQDCNCSVNPIQCAGETWPVGYVCCVEGVPCRYFRHKYWVVCLATNAYGYECSCAYWC